MDEGSNEAQMFAEFTSVDGHPDLITDPLLDSVGIAYQVEWSLFVCCRSLLHAQNLLSHCTRHHAPHLRPSAEVRARLAQLTDRWNVPGSYSHASPTVSPRVAVPGVPVATEMHGCPHCPVTGGLKYVRAHLAKRPHPSLTDAPLLEGLSAQLVHGAYCRVVARPRPAAEGGAPDSFRDQIAAFDLRDGDTRTGSNPRLVSAFLHRTRWHEIRAPFNDRLPQLIALASFPAHEELPTLVDAVRAYFGHADGLFEHTDELVLQRLNTHDPAKTGINNTPFHRHHNGDATAQQYVAVIIRLVAALVRRSEAFSMEPSEALTEAVDNLRASLLDPRQDADDAQKALHDVFSALWRARWPQSRDSRMPDPTMRFLMLLSSRESGEFAPAKDTSGPIRKLCWGIQMHALVEVHRLVDSERLSQVDAFERVAEYVVEKDITPYASLWSLQHYVTSLSRQTLSLPTVWWTERETWSELLYHGQRITIAQVQELFTQLEQEIVDLWEQEVLMGLDLRVEWSEITDDLTDTRPGYSFLTDPRNPFHAFKDAFARALDGSLEARKAFTTAASNHTRLDPLKCREWLHKLAKLEGLVMLLVDMLGGAPPRGTELVSMLASNTPLRLRNLCALGRHIAIVRQYDKTSNMTQSDRLIPHSVSAVAADVLIQIHSIARPWARFLASKIWPTDPSVARAYGEMLFLDVGKMFTSERLSQLMGSKTAPIVGWEVTISAWRHINIAWRRKLCGASAELLEHETVSSLNAMQGGHSVHTENMVYGLSPDALAGAPEDVLHLFLLVSGEWQKVVRMVPGGLGLDYRAGRCSNFSALVLAGVILTKGRKQARADGGQGEILAALARIEERLRRLEGAAQERIPLAAAAAPQPCPAPMIVDSPEVAAPVETPPSRDGQSPTEERPTSAPPRSPPPERARGQIDVLDRLRQLLKDPAAGWKDATQYEGVRECLALQRDVVVTSRTGSGKSLIAVVPSLVEDAVTVIVVPLVSLLEDWQRRLERFGIPYERFEGAANPTISGRTNIVLVTSDVVKQAAWVTAAAELARRRTISRVVFDEAHYYAADYDFRREALGQPYHVRGFNFQIVLLSATVPESAFRFLAREFELQKPLRITSGSHRPELELVVVRDCKDSHDQVERTKATLRAHVDRDDWEPDDRWIVFVSSLSDGNLYAKALGVPLYQAARGADKDQQNTRRQQIYREWIAGSAIGLVATNALGAGNDYGHVRVTIHINTPFNALLFEQQRGRAGRDGEAAYNYIIARNQPWVATNPPHPVFGDLVGSQVISDLVYKAPAQLPDRCLTFQLTSFFDGQGHTCDEFRRPVRCAGCDGQPPATDGALPLPHFDPAKPLWCSDEGTASRKRKLEEAFGPATHRAVKRRGLDLAGIQDGQEVFRRIFALVGQACGVCLCFGVEAPGEHATEECPTLEGKPVLKAAFQEFKRTVRYPRGVGGPCYRCHIASGGRDSLHPPFLKGGQAAVCPYPRLALSIAFGMYADPTWRQRALEYFAPQQAWDSPAGFAQWYATSDKQRVWPSMAMIRYFASVRFPQ